MAAAAAAVVVAAVLLVATCAAPTHAATRWRGRQQIDRLPAAEVTRAVFAQYMNAGRLLVVEGGAAGWRALAEWDLDWFIARFPEDAIQLRSAGSGVPYGDRPAMTLGDYRAWVAGPPDRGAEAHYFSWVNNEEEVSVEYLQECVHACVWAAAAGGAGYGCSSSSSRPRAPGGY